MEAKKMLLHMCCGPCSAYPVKKLREMGYESAGYFYNPNIHPYKEFRRRLETAEEFAGKVKLAIVTEKEYMLEEFLQAAMEAKEGRCTVCYELRLRQAAKYARENGYEAFTTSLLVSPYQKHELIVQVAQTVAGQEGVSFFYEDFRTGWYEGVEISKALELYRQPYCGCIFSERDRYYKPKKQKKA